MEQTAEDVASQEIDWAGIIAEEDAKLKSKALIILLHGYLRNH